jgi:hypothetical protein
MSRLHLAEYAVHHQIVITPVKRESFAKLKAQRHKRFGRGFAGLFAPAALSHFLTVLLDRPVSFAMAQLESLSRSFMHRTLPIISMVITGLSSAEKFSKSVEHPSQFSVGGDTFTFGWRRVWG